VSKTSNQQKQGVFKFFQTIPDDILIQIAINDWGSLERLCFALTLDIQLLKESLYETI
jgi:hypothetical protein